MCSYTTFEIKVDLCAHTWGKIGIFTRRVYSTYISTRTPSPFCAGSSWGLLSRKIFYFFQIVVLFLEYRILLKSIFKILVSTRYKFCSIFTCLRFSYSLLNFYSHQFRLVSALPIILFHSLSL